MQNKLFLLSLLGAIGAILMFAGDMLLYFKNVNYAYFSDNIIAIMGTIPGWRLTTGGFLGPIAGCFYFLGYYMLCRIIRMAYPRLGTAMLVGFLFCSILGSAYHTHFTYLGYSARYAGENAEFITSLEGILIPYFITNISLQTLLSLALGIAILTGNTLFPRWFVLFTPIVTLWFVYLADLLPQPANVIVYGGWFNIINIILFIAAAVILKKGGEGQDGVPSFH